MGRRTCRITHQPLKASTHTGAHPPAQGWEAQSSLVCTEGKELEPPMTTALSRGGLAANLGVTSPEIVYKAGEGMQIGDYLCWSP